MLAWARMSLFDVVHPAFPLPTTASPTLQGALEDGFGEASVTVGGLVLQVGDAEKFPQALGFEGMDLCLRQQTGSCFTDIEEDGSDKRLEELELACKADGVAPPDPI